MSSVLTITHPKICEYYRDHPSLNLEELNLKLLDILQSNIPMEPSPGTTASKQFIGFPPKHSSPATQLHDVKYLLSELQDFFTSANQLCVVKLLTLKSEYVMDIKTMELGTQSLQSSSLFLSEQNSSFLQKCWKMIFFVIPEPILKQKLSAMYDKFQLMFKQFQKTLQSNLETTLKTPDGMIDTAIYDYIQNFETNTGHLIQSIYQIMSDFVVSKDELAQKLSASQSPQIARLNYELQDILQSLRSPSATATQQHPPIEITLSQLYPTSSISLHMHDENSHHGYTVLRNDNQPTLYIQSMSIRDRNVNLDEIKQFTNTIQSLNVNGVFISQYTGVTSKPNYHIDIVNNKVVVYLHQMQHSPEKLQMAIDMVDHIHSKLCEFNMTPDNKYSIPKDVLEAINREYQSFISQKETITTFVKETNRKLLAQLEEFTFPQLDMYLLTKFSSCKKQGYTCDLCNQFTVGTLKGLAAHKRGCNRKLGASSSACHSVAPVKSNITVSNYNTSV
jgi:hypothetical protein